MQKEYKNFVQLVEEKEVFKTELSASIKADEDKKVLLDKQYKDLLVKNDDPGADKLQDDIYNLKKVIQRNQDKLQLIDESDEALEHQASKVLAESNEGIEALNIEAKALADEYHGMRKQMLDKAIELQKHQSKGTHYRHAMAVVIKNLDGFAETESKKPGSKLDYMITPNGKTISKYNNPAKNPELKPIEFQHIREAKTGIYVK